MERSEPFDPPVGEPFQGDGNGAGKPPHQPHVCTPGSGADGRAGRGGVDIRGLRVSVSAAEPGSEAAGLRAAFHGGTERPFQGFRTEYQRHRDPRSATSGVPSGYNGMPQTAIRVVRQGWCVGVRGYG